MKRLLLIIAAATLSFAGYAAGTVNFSAGGKYSKLFHSASDALLPPGANGSYPCFDITVGKNYHPSDSSDFARMYNYPIVGVGFSAALLNTMQTRENAYLGNMYNLYSFLEYDLWKNEAFSVGLKGNLGIGYNKGTFNPVTNPNNDFMGFPLMLYYGMGPYVKLRFGGHWEIGADAQLWHHSNGRMNLPNMGLNEWGVELFARYYVDTPYTGSRKVTPKKPVAKKFLWDVYAGGAPYVSDAIYFAYLKDRTREWPFKPQARFLVGGDVMYRYSNVTASGLALDFIYSTGNDRLMEADLSRFGKLSEQGYHPLYLAAAYVQEVFIGKVSMRASLGVHLFRRLGQGEALDVPTIFFQTLGARYYFQKLADTFIGFDCKVRYFSRADNLQFVVGKRF